MMGCRSSPMASEGPQGYLTSGADPAFDDLSETADDDEDWVFDGAIGENSVQRVDVKRRIHDLQDECCINNRTVLINVINEIELVKEFLSSSGAITGFIITSEVPNITVLKVAQSFAELERSGAGIAGMETFDTITVRRHEELMNLIGLRYAGEIHVWKETSRDNAKCTINDMRVAKAESVKIFVKQNFILTRFEEYVRAFEDNDQRNCVAEILIRRRHGEKPGAA